MITLDASHPSGPAEQVRAQIAALIQSGELDADERLPSVRQLAGDLRVAAGTVAKAYKELEAAGLVRTGRANGTRVNPGQLLDAPALKEVRRLVAAARNAGMSLDDVQGIVAVTWNA
ncbi:GntR family transcriptional regulator [Paeniglutamicibacter sulfureus]|jgi:DNA-binding transcriptional regulator YhcF (GntR family)|uniref:DNA-binding transcriptional regulator YhcF (GntR family) n=1 Tax=Paeniglutamicibacter sulfureus TaxID=43666 RepID=A0ABU2BFJ2_9MICC|nr:GntR family transcriptional regulator [Paeniglutamicibacter sulfureus]MDR7357391.1 DNA-binding transcriptional regulator YhcF (GntR family) [Paeniglutamicibacter sulfureus]